MRASVHCAADCSRQRAIGKETDEVGDPEWNEPCARRGASDASASSRIAVLADNDASRARAVARAFARERIRRVGILIDEVPTRSGIDPTAVHELRMIRIARVRMSDDDAYASRTRTERPGLRKVASGQCPGWRNAARKVVGASHADTSGTANRRRAWRLGESFHLEERTRLDNVASCAEEIDEVPRLGGGESRSAPMQEVDLPRVLAGTHGTPRSPGESGRDRLGKLLRFLRGRAGRADDGPKALESGRSRRFRLSGHRAPP